VEGDKTDKRKFKTYPIGYFHVDIAEVRTGDRLYLFVAIDRTSKFAFVELHEKATMRVATDFLQALIKAVPYKIHTMLTDNGIQFADLAKNRSKPKQCGAVIRSIALAGSTASSTGSQSPTIVGRTASQKNEPDDQGSDWAALLLRDPRPVARPSR
jgi:Integrase core domain